MPESQTYSGYYWAHPDSPDKVQLLERCQLPSADPNRLVCCVGYLIGEYTVNRPTVIFFPAGAIAAQVGIQLGRELGSTFVPSEY
ncbi:MAG TPA: hypothetical protein VLI54_04225 [Bacillota bacterium]|nr:hypothetical protein [Bacillota bacterium]